MKLCAECKEEKPFDMFHKDASRKDGHQSKCKECRYQYNINHKAELTPKRAQYYINNKARMDSYSAKYRQTHREQFAAYSKAYHDANPNQKRKDSDKRRARKLNAVLGFMPSNPLEALISAYGPLCIVPDCTALSTTVDHVIPLSKGGPHLFDNLQPMCQFHNLSKGNRNSIDYRPFIVSLV